MPTEPYEPSNRLLKMETDLLNATIYFVQQMSKFLASCTLKKIARVTSDIHNKSGVF